MSGPTELPVPDTADVRTGPEVSEELLSVLPLLGEWHGEGQAAGTAGDHRFGQWIRFSHDGRGFLAYESRTWRLTDDGGIVEGALLYAIDRAGPDGPPRPFMSARLERIR